MVPVLNFAPLTKSLSGAPEYLLGLVFLKISFMINKNEFFLLYFRNFYFLSSSLILQFMTFLSSRIPKDCLTEPPFNGVCIPHRH